MLTMTTPLHRLGLSLLAVALLVTSPLAQHVGPHKPTAAELLAEFGYEDTAQGLTDALRFLVCP